MLVLSQIDVKILLLFSVYPNYNSKTRVANPQGVCN